MGLLDRFKKGSDNGGGSSETPDGAGNFMHLAGLLSSAKYADLDCDIVIGGLEKRMYKFGLPVLENTVVDGAGHSIDAGGKARIFFIKEKNIVIKNITFINGFNGDGGAIVIDKNADVIIRDCTFRSNHAKKLGGAIINFGSLTLENVVFEGNVAEMEGAALDNQPGADMTISGCSFRQNNSAKNGGALMNMSDEPVRISDTEFVRNSAATDGGVINNNANSAQLFVDDCRFIDNRSGAGGGAIANWGNVTISNSQFQSNFSKTNGNDINFQKGSLKLSNVVFNYPKENSLYSRNEDLVDIVDCQFADDDE